MTFRNELKRQTGKREEYQVGGIVVLAGLAAGVLGVVGWRFSGIVALGGLVVSLFLLLVGTSLLVPLARGWGK